MPSEELQSALAKLTNLLNTVYPATEVVNLPHRESILKVAVLSFLPDELSIPILTEIQNAAYKCKPLSYEQILEMATAAEKHSMIKPTAALQFGRTIGASPSPAYFQLNSIVTDSATPSLNSTAVTQQVASQSQLKYGHLNEPLGPSVKSKLFPDKGEPCEPPLTGPAANKPANASANASADQSTIDLNYMQTY
jgi:hypothetical protein